MMASIVSSHLRRALAVLVASAAGALLCQGHPGAQTPSRIVAIADIHGDGDAFAGILQAAGLVDTAKKWSGGTARLVQTGDVLDRGPKVREALDLLMQLETQAPQAGGRVDALIGNHEAMNIVREFRDVNPVIYAAFATDQSESRRQRAYDDYATLVSARAKRLKTNLQPKGKEEWLAAHPAGFLEYVEAMGPTGTYGKWFRTHKVVLQAGDTIFMHAGIDPAIAPASLDDINTRVLGEIRTWDEATDAATKAGVILPFFTLQETLEFVRAELQRIAEALKAKQPAGDEVTREYVERLQAVDNIGASWLLAPEGPLWFRGFANWTDQDRPKLEGLLAKYHVARFTSSHTVQQTFRITPHFDRRILLLDTGMLSAVYKGGRASALEIVGDQLTAIYTDGREVIK
jgi:Calcineurin-like phosphoesterase